MLSQGVSQSECGKHPYTHTVCVLHPGVFTILLFNSNPYDGPYDRLASSHAACLVTLLCILQHNKNLGGKKL